MRAKTYEARLSGTILRVPGLLLGQMKVTIVMRTEYLAAIVIAVLAAATGLAVNSLGSLPSEKQTTPATVQLALARSVDPFLLPSGG